MNQSIVWGALTMRRMKYKYCVEIAYLDTDTDSIKVEYNAHEAKEDAYSYMNRFPNVSYSTLMEVYRA